MSQSGLRIHWEGAKLSITGPALPHEVGVWYVEGFCRPGGRERPWRETLIPNRIELIEAPQDGRYLHLRSMLPTRRGEDPSKAPVIVDHHIRVHGPDEVRFEVVLENRGAERVEVESFLVCVRVAGVTARSQEDYLSRCFVFTDRGLTPLHQTRRIVPSAAPYDGQVYLPPRADPANTSPRPSSPDRPVNGLIGCFTPAGDTLVATAWEPCQQLFQGPYTCLHSDPHVGGLDPAERKRVRGALYVLPTADELLRRHREATGE